MSPLSRWLSCVLLAACVLGVADEASARRRDGPAASARGLRPAGGPFGLGLNLGWPTGLAGKYFLSSDSGVTFGVGLGGHSLLGAYVDYVFAPTSFVRARPGALYPYLGIGAFGGVFGFGKTFVPIFPPGIPISLGAEVPLGLAWSFYELPIDLYGELAPGLQVLPGLGFGFRGSLGFRFYF